VGEIFTNFNLFIYGGVNFEPYRAKFENLIGRKVDSIVSGLRGFLPIRILRRKKRMLLLLNAGIFYEFVKSDEFYSDKLDVCWRGGIRN
jgi:hypothetical protein